MSPLFRKKDESSQEQQWFLPQEQQTYLRELFQQLNAPVQIHLYTAKGTNDAYNDFARKFCTDLARLSESITVHEHDLQEESAQNGKVTRSPTLLINPEQFNIRFTGAPAGEEGRSFIQTLLLVSTKNTELGAESKQLLHDLDDERRIRVFVNPNCPYCPGQCINAIKAAVQRPDLVSAECVETVENPDLADTYAVGSVPHTVINEWEASKGLLPLEAFLYELVTLTPVQEALDASEETHSHAERPVESCDVVIVGAGPAGLTAAIYLERAGLQTVVLEKDIIGGQVAVTPVVENYPAFTSIGGKQLMEMVESQAREYADIREGEEVEEIKVGKAIETLTRRSTYHSKSLLLATGATWKKLDVPGEDRLFGKGVGYCATCDGYLFKEKRVHIVGGGNTAVTEALHLKNLGAEVALIHRRDALRAEPHLQRSLEHENIPVLWNTIVEEIVGQDKVTGLRLKNVQSGTPQEVATDGIFIAVGESPNTQLARDLGITLDAHGYIQADRSCRTTIPRIYAAGDAIGGVNQIVTAVGEGATAALSIFHDWQKTNRNT
ncbi:FAD-dependent oxidoreductase [Desulfohalobium retbaense]|uniref:FAD-dependent pyridine nucleotide-disulphide oxidoreductase n=1 Tax=Desulfohalobium retbaense (strain ATCC 49708 / DSM 5692 / JCM 16813 / HR100) TaxID=485915 RepID=C8X0W7_DESRD|nr:FAD-dependent oxidoreductase [Desulfohalobium retbaense]ACV68064.1 FAD-dependent pyridine nucleotide-disulphide oxidoreductase [Desulfohalobium retbaense DSM 5692]